MNRCSAIIYVFEITITLCSDYGLSKFNFSIANHVGCSNCAITYANN